MDFIIISIAGIVLVAMTVFYMYLVATEKIEPHVPTRIQRGNFWDAETKKFYKWDELMKLKKEREKK